MNPEDLRAAFQQRQPTLNVFGKWVTNRVVDETKKILGASYSDDFFKVPPKPRVKDADGFIEKASRVGKNYSDPLRDITDQVGTRFVVMLYDQCEIVNRAIRSVQEWECENAKDIEEIRISNPHHFDYESYHWTVRLRMRMTVEGITLSSDMTCEIQVRTLLQHAYAELAHSTIYKPKATARPQVKRIIARGAALIETTDGVFLQVAKEIEKVSGKVSRLLTYCAEWYSSNVAKGQYPASGAALRVSDAFSEELTQIDPSHIESFLSERKWLNKLIQDNLEKPLFGDPLILLVFWLVNELEGEISERWPLELSYLRPVFTKLGISAGEGLF